MLCVVYPIVQKQDRGECSYIWNRVMEHWMNGGSVQQYPVTWDGLYDLLRDTNYPIVADDLKEAVSKCSIQHD